MYGNILNLISYSRFGLVCFIIISPKKIQLICRELYQFQNILLFAVMIKATYKTLIFLRFYKHLFLFPAAFNYIKIMKFKFLIEITFVI